MNGKYFNAIAMAIIIGCFFVAGLAKAHDTVVVDERKTGKALALVCSSLVEMMERDGQVLPENKKAAIKKCITITANSMGAELHLHDHT